MGLINSKSLLIEWVDALAHIQSCGQKVIYIHLHSTMHLFTPPPHTHTHTDRHMHKHTQTQSAGVKTEFKDAIWVHTNY